MNNKNYSSFFKKLSKINAVLISHGYTLVCLLKILFLKTVLVFLDRIEVFSPEIASIGYDDAEMLLQVEFHNLCIYNFFDVPRDTYERCVCSDNIEGYFQTNIENYFESDRIL